MSSTGSPQNAANTVLTAGTEFYSVPNRPGAEPDRTNSPHLSEVSARNIPESARERSPGIPRPLLTLLRDEDGQSYAVNEQGLRFEVHAPHQDPEDNRPPSSLNDDGAGVPLHYTRLFPDAYDARGNSVGEPSTESALSESLPVDTDIDYTNLTTTQVEHLNAIRGHLGTTQARLQATMAIMAEQQEAAEVMQDTLQGVRSDVASRLASLRNEIHAHRSRLNRCLDDNVRILRETGASSSHIKNLLQAMSNRPIGPIAGEELLIPEMKSDANVKTTLPPDIRSQTVSIIAPRATHESTEDFEKRAKTVLKNKEREHSAFPLPDTGNPQGTAPIDRVDIKAVPGTRTDPLYKAARFGQLPSSAEYHSVGSASRARVSQQVSHAQNWRGASSISRQFQAQPPPVAMNNSASAYATGHDQGRDILSEFAENAADSLRETIDNKLSIRLDLPPNVRTPRVSEPVKYSGEDDHDFFTVVFLEKLLAWMRAGNFGGPELDAYRVVLLQSYLDGEAHRWYITEINEYSKENGGDSPEFAEVICSLHCRFVKSSTAQRATRAFDNVRWNAESGPEQLFTDLLDKGRLMVEAPSALTLRHRFMNLLPRWVTKQMKMNRGLTAEFSTLETLRTHARQIWEVDAALREEDAHLETGRSAPQRPRRDRSFAEQPRNQIPPRREVRRTESDSAPRRDNRDATRTAKDDKTPKVPGVKVCFSCGGNHYAKDKICPNYSESQVPRRIPRVAAQRVLESFSDEGSQSEESEETSDEYDANASPDLGELVSRASEEDEVRLSAMRGQTSREDVYEPRYYAMRIAHEEDDTEESIMDTESSVTEGSSIESITDDEFQDQGTATPVLGNYNPGPVCVVCQECALVIRQVPATPENGLVIDQTYTICEHLANVGLDPSWIPIVDDESLDTATSGEDSDGEPRILSDIPRNRLGDPDFEQGTIIDITNPISVGIYSVESEIYEYDQARVRAGLRSLTALEYYVNTQWLTHYRYYAPNPAEEPHNEYQDYVDQEQGGGIYGRTLRHARTILREITEAQDVATSIYPVDGDYFCPDFVLDDALQAMSNELRPHNMLYNLRIRELHLRGRAAIARTQYRRLLERSLIIAAALDNSLLRGYALEQWERAQTSNNALRGDFSYSRDQYTREYLRVRRTLDRLRNGEGISLQAMRDANTASLQTLHAITLEGRENLGTMPLDEANLWAATTPISNSELELLQLPTSSDPLSNVSDHASERAARTNEECEGFLYPPVDDEDEYDRQRGTGYNWAQELAHREAVMELNRPRGWGGPNDSDDEQFFFAVREVNTKRTKAIQARGAPKRSVTFAAPNTTV
ncbi:hypothetical protein B0H12DRAFT_1081391 [Mycena haematopus]|nr:hypothetical protein B0H12DRAFT_1081391 [Mycena haematopus]